jgi:DNA-binding NarL/FixJ family response regulator
VNLPPAPDLLTAIARTIAQALIRAGVEPSSARSAASKSCTDLCRDWGGEYHWLPRVDRVSRDRAVAQALSDGKPVKQVATEQSVSVRTVLRIRSRCLGFGRDDWVL